MKSGYDLDTQTFTLTATKMEYYHRHHPHTSFPRSACPICHAQYGREYMDMIAAFLIANGFDVMDTGEAHVTIKASSKPRKKFGTWITKETDALYQLFSGRIEPRSESLQLKPDMLDSEISPSFQADNVLPGQDDDPLLRLNVWLNDLKAQKQSDLKHADVHIELALIEQIQAKIQELLE